MDAVANVDFPVSNVTHQTLRTGWFRADIPTWRAGIPLGTIPAGAIILNKGVIPRNYTKNPIAPMSSVDRPRDAHIRGNGAELLVNKYYNDPIAIEAKYVSGADDWFHDQEFQVFIDYLGAPADLPKGNCGDDPSQIEPGTPEYNDLPNLQGGVIHNRYPDRPLFPEER